MAKVINTRVLRAAALLSGVVSSLVLAVPAEVDKVTRKEIAERIAPVGSVCLEGEPCASAVAVIDSGPRTGDAIFNQFCTACHSTGVLGAPKKGDTVAWAARKKAAGSYSTLLSHAINGVNAMPAKGTCASCSDDEISAAIQYMSGLTP